MSGFNLIILISARKAVYNTKYIFQKNIIKTMIKILSYASKIIKNFVNVYLGRYIFFSKEIIIKEKKLAA